MKYAQDDGFHNVSKHRTATYRQNTTTASFTSSWVTGLMRGKILALLSCITLLGSCAPLSGERVEGNHGGPQWEQNHFVTRDGAQLPLKTWLPEANPPAAVIIAVHGFNDYHRAFALAGPYWAEQGIVVYAYDQRGFGAAPERGRWPGVDRLVSDLQDLIALARERHPALPLAVLGDSMGAAVTMATLRHPATPKVDGMILNAPAVWGRSSFNPFYRVVLWAAAHTVPWWQVTGSGLKIRVSDNREWLRELSKDPLMIRETRIDALYGIVKLMDEALAEPVSTTLPTLVLYGLRDEVIPPRAVCRFVDGLPATIHRTLWYPEGYHMLLRDLQANRVWADVGSWLRGQEGNYHGQITRPEACPLVTRITELDKRQERG